MKTLAAITFLLTSPVPGAQVPSSGDDYFASLLCARPPVPARLVAAQSPDTRLRTRFDPRTWSGELSKERLTGSGGAIELWRASEQLPRQRRIQIADGLGPAGLTDFTWATLNEAQRATLDHDPSGRFDGYGAARVLALRGEDCSELPGCAALRQRLPVPGDIVNGRPLTIAAPNRHASTMDSYDGAAGTYATFKAKPRRAQIYLGANEGMLHAFDADTGQERLAIIPHALAGKLAALTSPGYANGDPHRFFVDGPLVADDVFFANAWHTVLLVSFGAGAPGLLALDVTDPDRVRLLWEYDTRHDPQLGHLLTAPTIARLHTGQWAAVLGNGIDAPAGSAALLLLDIQTGAVIRRLGVGGQATGLAMPRVADTNGDGDADYAYAGDNLGNLWRFDLYDPSQGNLNKPPAGRPVSASMFRLAFGGQPLFRTPASTQSAQPQPISMAPAIVSHPSQSGYLLVFGSGQNHLMADRGGQSLYGIWDRYTRAENAPTFTTITAAQLQEQRLSTQPGSDGQALNLTRHAIDWHRADGNSNGKLGWYLDLQPAAGNAAGERLTDSPMRLGELLGFTTRVPSLLPCQADLHNRVYVIDAAVGGGTLFPVFDVNGDGVVDDRDQGAGPPPSAISTPAETGLTVTPGTGAPCVLGEINCAPIPLGPRANGRQSWRVVNDGTP